MKQSLQLKLGQNLTMTPQLQQAIKLLQLPSIELQTEIQQILESNPLLETEEESFESNRVKQGAPDELPIPNLTNSIQDDAEHNNLSNNEMNSPADDSYEVDGAWETLTANYSISGFNHSDESGDSDIYEAQNSNETTLQDHLYWQLNLTQMSDTDRTIATAIIDAIDEDGYLREETDAIYVTLSKDLGPETELELEEVKAVLKRIQHFDPIGVGASTPRECLLLQLEIYLPSTPGFQLAKTIIENHLELLAAHDYTRLKRITNTEDDELKEAEILIQCLQPKPGALITSAQTEYIVPDVFVIKRNGVWRVELNQDLTPRLRINAMYAGMIQRASKSEDNTYLKTNLQEARWFLKSLQSRNDTILKVANNIVQKQRAFFEYGEEAMRPMILKDIAEALEMHESTISRVTNQKYMHTPRGIYEFKYFFSSHVSTDDGGECSATAIRAMIKKLVSSENSLKPLSDSKIADMLGKQGIQVARRTVAKYRESLLIPASNERKRLS